MIRILRLCACCLALFVFCAGCAGRHGPERKTVFYALEYDPPPVSIDKPVSAFLRVERFHISPIYDTDKLVFSEKKSTRDHYNYHKWLSAPRDLVTYYVTRDLMHSQLFKAVFPYSDLRPADYVLTGTIDDFYENEIGGSEAVLSLHMALIVYNERDPSKKILIQKQYEARKKCAEKSPASFAEAMGSAMSDISREIMADLQKCFSDMDR